MAGWAPAQLSEAKFIGLSLICGAHTRVLPAGFQGLSKVEGLLEMAATCWKSGTSVTLLRQQHGFFTFPSCAPRHFLAWEEIGQDCCLIYPRRWRPTHAADCAGFEPRNT